MLTLTYLPHAIYSLAITSVSIHLVNQKRTITDERARISGRISILESIAQQLREDKDISIEELDRLHRLARPLEETGTNVIRKDGDDKENIGWKETLFGRKRNTKDGEMSEYDRRDWEKLQKELETQR